MKRSKWKGLFTKPKNPKNKETIHRNNSIIPKFIENTFYVHNGKNFKTITVSKEMLKHKFGEFVKTRANFEYKKKKKKKKPNVKI